MDDPLSLVVRVVHIGFGVFWAGAGVMLAAFILPAVRALGPDGGRFVQRMMGPGRFGHYMTLAGILTAVSGVILLFTESGGGLGTWFSSGYGLSIVIGSAAGLAAFLTGLTVNAPTARRMAALSASIQDGDGPPTPEQAGRMQSLQSRLRSASNLVAVLLAASVVCMAAAHVL